MIFTDRTRLPIEMVGKFYFWPNPRFCKIRFSEDFIGIPRKSSENRIFRTPRAQRPHAGGPRASALSPRDGPYAVDYAVGWCLGRGLVHFPGGSVHFDFPRILGISKDPWNSKITTAKLE